MALIYLNCERNKKTAKKSFFSHNSQIKDIMSKFDNIKKLIVKDKLKLDCGQTISDFPIAYETYGKLNGN